MPTTMRCRATALMAGERHERMAGLAGLREGEARL
jgi:hypothetical protein